MIEMAIKERLSSKYYMKNIHFDFPNLNVFKGKDDLLFIPSCIPSFDDRFRYGHEKKDEKGNVIGIEFHTGEIPPYTEAWGIEVQPQPQNKKRVQTTLYYRRIVPNDGTDWDEVLKKYVVATFSMIQNNLDALINALENDSVKSEIDKEFISVVLNKLIKENNL